MILLLALALLALCATAASASTTVSYDPATGALVQGDGAGEGVQIATLSGPDRLEVARSTLDGRVVRATLVPGNGCQAGGTDIDGQITSVRCQLTSNRIVTANLGDGADGFRSEPGQPISIAGLFIDGGGGDDLVTGVGTADQIRGGAGNDQLSRGAATTSSRAATATTGSPATAAARARFAAVRATTPWSRARMRDAPSTSSTAGPASTRRTTRPARRASP